MVVSVRVFGGEIHIFTSRTIRSYDSDKRYPKEPKLEDGFRAFDHSLRIAGHLDRILKHHITSSKTKHQLPTSLIQQSHHDRSQVQSPFSGLKRLPAKASAANCLFEYLISGTMVQSIACRLGSERCLCFGTWFGSIIW